MTPEEMTDRIQQELEYLDRESYEIDRAEEDLKLRRETVAFRERSVAQRCRDIGFVPSHARISHRDAEGKPVYRWVNTQELDEAE